MKIIAATRTRNEEHNIGRFCEAYQNIADQIFIADGGSVDNTIEIALSYPNVVVRKFEEQIKGKDGSFFNPEGRHINFLLDWAAGAGPDWIIFDDTDCVPNYLLREEAREILKTSPAAIIHMKRVYFWGFDQIFQEMHEKGFGLWAWRAEEPIRAVQLDKPNVMEIGTYDTPVYDLDFPYCLLHYFCPTPEAADAKVKHYRESGRCAGAQHPFKFGGPLAPPEPFMVEKREDLK